MLYNLEIDIILNDKLLKDNFYFYLSKYNVNIFHKSETQLLSLKEKILYLNDYEFPLNYDYSLIDKLECDLKLGENTYLITKDFFSNLDEDQLKNLQTKYCFFKCSDTKQISLDKMIEYKKYHHDFKSIFNDDNVFKNTRDFLIDFKIKPLTFIITDKIMDCVKILSQVLSIYDEQYDNVLIFLENPNLEIIKMIQNRKNIKLNKDFTIENMINNTSNFQNIIILKESLEILNDRELIEKINLPVIIKLTKSLLILNQIVNNSIEKILDNSITFKVDLKNQEQVETYIENLFIHKCYSTTFDIIERSIEFIIDSKKYNEFIIKYISLGLITGQYEKISNNLEKFVKNNFNLDDFEEILPILYNFENSQQCLTIIIKKFSINLNNDKIKFIEKIIDNFKGKNLEKSLILSILTFLKNVKESKILDSIKLNELVEKCYKLSSYSILLNSDILEFWTNFYFSVDSTMNIVQIFERYKKSPEFIYYIGLNIPKVFKSNKEMNTKRSLVDTSLNFFNKNWETIIPLDEIYKFPSLNFRLSYHGLSNREIFTKSSKFFRKMCPELNYKMNLDYNNPKIKILFVSEFLGRQHSVFKDRHQVIKYLSYLDDFEVHFTTFGDISTAVTRFEFGQAKHINMPKNIIKAKEIIEKEKYDVIFYCEIGMALIPFFLAHMKLAKYQFNTWGHSDTSGINTIDYFISSKYFELEYEQAQKHYTEKLILMDSLSTCYVNPLSRHPNKKWLERSDYGYSENITIYSCLQSTFKYSPDFFETLEQIMNNDNNAILLVIAKERIDKDFMDVISKFSFSNRIHKYNALQHDEYLNLIKISDIMLETFPFGSCNSSLEAFSLGKPVVTLPSDLINGRFTYGFYKYMGIEDLIVYSKKDYINLALKLSKDKKFYSEFTKLINKNSNRLFMDMETCKEYEMIFRNLKL